MRIDESVSEKVEALWQRFARKSYRGWVRREKKRLGLDYLAGNMTEC